MLHTFVLETFCIRSCSTFFLLVLELGCYSLTSPLFQYKLAKLYCFTSLIGFRKKWLRHLLPPTNFSQVWSLSEQGLLMDTLDGMGAPVTYLALYDCTLVSDSCSVMYFRVWNLVCKQQQEILARVTDTGCTAVSHRGNDVYLTQPEDRQEVIIWDATEGELHLIQLSLHTG